jgi:multiple sugar transport system ATP-binding protein
MARSDRIVVMSEAVVQQVGAPAEVYYNPANLFVAKFIGSPGMNLIPGNYSEGSVHVPGEDNRFPVPEGWRRPIENALQGETEVTVGFRPESAQLNPGGRLNGEVYANELQGAYAVLHVNVNSSDIVHIRTDRLVDYPIGARVRFDLDPKMVRFFNPQTEAAIKQEVQV